MVHTMLLLSDVIPAQSLQVQNFPFKTLAGFGCDVVFGSPSVGCSGTGICKITGTNSVFPSGQARECQRTKAIMMERPDQQGITLVFFRAAMCAKLYRRHFWKGILKVDEPCELPATISSKLEQPFNAIIPGRYTVVEEAGFFRVDIDCI